MCFHSLENLEKRRLAPFSVSLPLMYSAIPTIQTIQFIHRRVYNIVLIIYSYYMAAYLQ